MNSSKWQNRLQDFPYARFILSEWLTQDHSGDQNWLDYEQALNAYLASQDSGLSLKDRYESLIASRNRFQALSLNGDGHAGTRLALIRIYADLGEQAAAKSALEELVDSMPWLSDPIPEGLRIRINRPFISPTADFDNRPIQDDLGNWLQSALAQTLEQLSAAHTG